MGKKMLYMVLVVALWGCAQSTLVKKKETRRSTPRGRAVESKPTVDTTVPEAGERPAWWGQKHVVVIDVRTTEEFVNGHVQGATLMSFEDPNFQEQVSKLDKRKTYLLYCASGSRAGKALRYFKSFGLKAQNLGGLDSLKSQGVPVESLRR